MQPDSNVKVCKQATDDISVYRGPSYEEVLAKRKEHVTPSASTNFRSPLLIHRGEMQYLYGHNGIRYLDMFAGIVTVSVGHCHP